MFYCDGDDHCLGGGESNESAIDRELRMRAEAKERLRQKFGSSGLKGMSVSSHPMPVESDSTNQFNSDVLQKKGEEALNSLTSAFSSFSTAAMDVTSKAAQKLKEADLAKQIQDDKNLEKLKERTASSWAALSSGATSLWSKVKQEANPDVIWNSLNEISKPRSGGGSDGVGDGERDENGETRMEKELRLQREAKERIRAKFGDQGLAGNSVSSQPLPAELQPKPSASGTRDPEPQVKKEDDDAWLLEQLANTKVPPRSSSSPPTNRKTSQAKTGLTGQSPQRPASSSGKKPEKVEVKPPKPAGNDFFSSFGVN